MLVLSRKRGERIVVPEIAMMIELVEIRGDKVRLGIDVRKDLEVHREEVWTKIVGQDAQGSPGGDG
jgi:carbon storage regulator